MGLGLAIGRCIAEAHGGAIELESAPGKARHSGQVAAHGPACDGLGRAATVRVFSLF